MMIRYFLAANGNSLKQIDSPTILIIVLSFNSHLFLNNLSRNTNLVNSQLLKILIYQAFLHNLRVNFKL